MVEERQLIEPLTLPEPQSISDRIFLGQNPQSEVRLVDRRTAPVNAGRSSSTLQMGDRLELDWKFGVTLLSWGELSPLMAVLLRYSIRQCTVIGIQNIS